MFTNWRIFRPEGKEVTEEWRKVNNKELHNFNILLMLLW
jgi:hypothetical protein